MGFFSEEEDPQFSWTIVGFSAMIWGIIACIFRNYLETAKVNLITYV